MNVIFTRSALAIMAEALPAAEAAPMTREQRDELLVAAVAQLPLRAAEFVAVANDAAAAASRSAYRN